MNSEKPMWYFHGGVGWVRADSDAVPGPVYVRLGEARGRWFPTEVYIDGRGAEITATHLRDLAWVMGTAVDFATGTREVREAWVDSRYEAVDLSALASHYANGVAGARYNPPRRADPERPREDEDEEPPPPAPPGRPTRLDDEFLRQVADYYRWALRSRRRPNQALKEATGAKDRTVEQWVYLARKAGHLAKTRPGKAG